MITYGQLEEGMKIALWITVFGLSAIPIFSTWSLYRFMRKVSQLRKSNIYTYSLHKNLPAIIIAACHFLPLFTYDVWLIGMKIENNVIIIGASTAYPFLVLLLQIVAFGFLSNILKRTENDN